MVNGYTDFSTFKTNVILEPKSREHQVLFCFVFLFEENSSNASKKCFKYMFDFRLKRTKSFLYKKLCVRVACKRATSGGLKLKQIISKMLFVCLFAVVVLAFLFI